MKFPLANGWTLSCVQVHAPFFSVAAWPTVDLAPARGSDRQWFVFASGGIEERVCSLAEFIEIAGYIAGCDSPD